MTHPDRICRYRPLDATLLDRELGAIKDAYLFAPPFGAMNDPMEAFYETGGPGDRIVDAMLAPAGKRVKQMYDLLTDMIDRFALVSLSSTHLDLPMWAYYASNFSGMCLEFSTTDLDIGDFQGEQLRPVTYASRALPALTLADMAPERIQEAIIARITRKRAEWAHEKEWRFVTGELGPKHYVDDALKRVFLGPRVDLLHAKRVCEVLSDRPTEVLQGEIHGFDLVFQTIKPPRPLEQCERIGAGRFVPKDIIYDQKELANFLEVPLEALMEECSRIALRPNVEEIADISISVSNKKCLYITTMFKLRNKRELYEKRYFDRRFKLVNV